MEFVILTIQSFLGAYGANWMGTWLPLSILAVMTSVIIHNILLMIAKAFSIKDLENYATAEILQAASTAFMTIFLVVMVSSAMTVAGSYITGSITCNGNAINIKNDLPGSEYDISNKVMDTAYSAILCRVQDKARTMAIVQNEILTSGETIDTFMKLNIALSNFGITWLKGDWFSSVYRDAETRRLVNNLATTILIALNTQAELISYIRVNMLHIFLPVGILLRSFYFTRGPGAFMISLAIGLYFVFPMFYVLLDPGFIPAPPPPPPGQQAAPQFCYPTMSSAITLISTINTPAGSGTGSALSFAEMRNELSKTYISIMLHPLVAFFLTLVFVRYMMSVLGADTTDLTKMVTKVI